MFDECGSRVDMRQRIGTLGIDGVRLDPSDPSAVRCPHGSVITADGYEAEIATAPVRSSTHAIGHLNAHLAEALQDLTAALGEDAHLMGYSTHLNVEVTDRGVKRIGRRLVRSWSPALMLLTLHPDSPGLLVRPRWRRLELGCEHITGEQLANALTFSVGATAAATRRRRAPWGHIDVEVEPSRQRFGWYIDRAAFGNDILRHGRGTVLRRGRRGTMSAQALLEEAWSCARPYAVELLGIDATAPVDDVVNGRTPTASEAGRIESSPVAAGRVDRQCFEYDVGDVSVRPAVLTWRTAVFEVRAPGRCRWIEVPGESLDSFLGELHCGRFDAVLLSGGRRSRLDLHA